MKAVGFHNLNFWDLAFYTKAICLNVHDHSKIMESKKVFA